MTKRQITKRTTNAAKKVAAKTSGRTWTAKQLQFLIDNAAASQRELLAAFRRRFRTAAARSISDKAIVNRRYYLLHNAERTAYAVAYRAAS